jgi:heptosyltransferase I
MRVLIVKTSSMGDVIHTLPALTDAGNAIPGITFDWVVEENFAEIPAWHPLVKNVIPIAWRRWRKQLFAPATRAALRQFLKKLRAQKYDLIIDAQGLAKSAFCSVFAKGTRVGPDWKSARESIAAICYNRRVTVDFQQHAITRMRTLFSGALSYPLPVGVPDYGIDRKKLFASNDAPEPPYLVFLHGTTWATKHWPEASWLQLTLLANQNGYHVKLPWGNDSERERAERIAKNAPNATVLPRQDLLGMAKILAGAQAVAAVDTGLGHLAAALNVPAVSLYGPTDPKLTGALGESQVHLCAQFACAPCFGKICTYAGGLSAGRLSEDVLSGKALAESTSPLYPACFGSLTPTVVWSSLCTVLKRELSSEYSPFTVG